MRVTEYTSANKTSINLNSVYKDNQDQDQISTVMEAVGFL